MNLKLNVLLLTLGLLFSLQQNYMTDDSKIQKGMIKVAIFYTNEEGKTFDMDYYSNKHMPMAASLFGDDLKAMSIDKGIGGIAPDSPAKYSAIGYFYFESMEVMQKSMGAHSERLRKDVPNYTNIRPEIQISEVQRAE